MPRTKKTESKKTTSTKRTKKTSGISISVVSVDGKVSSKTILPEDIFKNEVNKPLLAQAVRVYQANRRQGSASTKKRGEVRGSTRKIYRQKGTGRARHGDRKAPIFVGGGIVFGPKPRDFSLKLPEKMRKKALLCALSLKVKENKILVVSSFDSIGPKTKSVAQLIEKLKLKDEKRALFVLGKKNENFKRAARNISHVSLIKVSDLNAFEVLRYQNIVFEKDALNAFKN